MPIYGDPYGGSSGTGGGTTTSVCRISPSDELVVLGNYGDRISDIERFLSKLVYADIYADNLSDLARNLGNVLNGTITLPASNTSPYGPGGSVPVDGFNGTVISGNVITTWVDGVVSFEVINAPGGGLSLPTALFSMSGGSLATGPSSTTINFTTVTGQSFVTNNTTSLTISPGLYLIAIGGGGSIIRTTTSTASEVHIRVGSPISGNQDIGFGAYFENAEATTSSRYLSGSMFARFPDDLSGVTITGTGSKSGTPTVILGPSMLGICRIGA